MAEVIAGGAVLSSADLAKVLGHFADRGADPSEILDRLTRRGVLGAVVEVEPLLVEDALEAARLRPLTRHAGLSLADRACRALARRLGLSAFTAARAWSELDVGVDVRQIR